MKIMLEFKPLTLSDEHVEMLYGWLNNPHVVERWDPPPQSREQVRKKYKKKIDSQSGDPYLIYIDSKPVGYIQSYYAPEVGQGWWEDEPAGTWGMDLFIGQEDMLGKGYGAAIVKSFVKKLFTEKNAKKIIIDPKPDNARAIRVYEKAGFKKIKEINTPDGLALLMEMRRE